MLGDRIKEVRLKRGMSVSMFAKSVGVSDVAVYSYESGVKKPSLDNFECICGVLNVSADYLLGRSSRMEPIIVPTDIKEYLLNYSEGKDQRVIDEFNHVLDFLRLMTRDIKVK